MEPTLQEVKSESLEFVDLYIPIIRYNDAGNYWSVSGVYYSLADAKAAIIHCTGVAEMKILHHTERLVKV